MAGSPKTLSERLLLGAHVSTSGGVFQAIERAVSIGCTAMQIFVKNNMQWSAPPLGAEEIQRFTQHPERGQLRVVFGHSGYLINLAATGENRDRSIRSLRLELERADALELPFLVLHPGAHLGIGQERGMALVAEALDEIHEQLPKIRCRVALETTAGQGSSLGHRLEELAAIRATVKAPERLCYCLDTAHLFAGGYDLTTETGTRNVLTEIDSLLKWKNVAAIHLNDSKTGLGSRVDRHEHIGKGKIGLEAFRVLMNEPQAAQIPKVLETPKGKEMKEDVENMQRLRALLRDVG